MSFKKFAAAESAMNTSKPIESAAPVIESQGKVNVKTPATETTLAKS